MAMGTAGSGDGGHGDVRTWASAMGILESKIQRSSSDENGDDKDLVSKLIDSGVAIVRLRAGEARLIHRIDALGRQFFAQSELVKRRCQLYVVRMCPYNHP